MDWIRNNILLLYSTISFLLSCSVSVHRFPLIIFLLFLFISIDSKSFPSQLVFFNLLFDPSIPFLSCLLASFFLILFSKSSILLDFDSNRIWIHFKFFYFRTFPSQTGELSFMRIYGLRAQVPGSVIIDGNY